MKAPLKLSSEMRILLAALVLVALVGGWYTWNNRTTGDQITAPSVTAPVTPTATAAPKPNGAAPSGSVTPAKPPVQVKPPAASAGTPGTVTPARPTTVLTIPPLSSAASSKPGAKPGTAATSVTETDAEVQRPPAGINPATPLAAVPVVNPFSPLKVVADPNSNPAPVPATAQVPQQQIRSAPSVAVTPPVRTSGVIPSTPIPVAEVSAAPSGPRTGGIMPAPAINSGAQAALDAKAAAATQKQALAEQAKAQQIAQADAKRAEAAQAKAQAEQQAAQAKLDAAAKAQVDRAAKTQAIAEAKAKLLAAQQAKRAADIAAAQAAARAKASTSAPVGVSATSNTPAPSTPAPNTAAPVAVTPETNAAVGTVQPGVITQLGNNAPSAATPAPAPSTVLNTLDRYLQERSLSFDSVVLGPLNTAIFKTDRGLVVVSVGQNIPDTNITVREVTASSATLALDTNTKTLQLEKR